jgi:hypothetical protein
MHGYAVARWISDTTNDDLQIEEGALKKMKRFLTPLVLDREAA